jgi:uncharacterized protein YoxC
MAAKQHPLTTLRARTLLNYLYSFGASVVIGGALFKILHWPGANTALIIGMGTEVVVFFIFGFEPQHAEHAEYEWERVYPELAEDAAPVVKGGKPLTQQLDKMLSDAKVGPDLINSLGKGFTTLGDSVSKLNDLTEATVAANDFSKNTKNASSQINTFAQAAIYELELQDSNNHLKAMNKFFGNLNAAASALSETATDAVKYKDNLVQLNKNLTSLNSVYGNMLSAMKSV